MSKVEGSSDPEIEEDHLSFDEPESDVVSSSLSGTSQSSVSCVDNSARSVVGTESSSLTEPSILPVSVIPSSETTFSVPASVEFIDPRVAAILQNFQNNGNVQIHFHFNDRK
jgi:hypothetical protein